MAGDIGGRSESGFAGAASADPAPGSNPVGAGLAVAVTDVRWPEEAGSVPPGVDGAAPDGMRTLSACAPDEPILPRRATASAPEITSMVTTPAAVAIHLPRGR
ncbi:hypothetical protein FDG2_4674 [Candidatus Protofrankia californiensis]|uniref:Uncharacterized protein n=1 Tax=Candidatus Protofrankia californiensis TaxID=1839754 RepID=A0A1C3P7K3_9ACTN|nr:hypothetical protein FDG2_4674 [Candidatus Protofrankia californiensis]